MSVDRGEIVGKLSAAWKRQIVSYSEPIHAVYADEALTGWVAILESPKIASYNGMKCVLVPLSIWVMLKTLGAETVTPFRIVAKGKSIIAKGFMPHTGLKYAVRNTAEGTCLHIPVEDFEGVV